MLVNSLEVQRVEPDGTVALNQGAVPQGSRFGALARDVATMGAGTALAAVFNTLLIFLIPRLVTVEDFGYWRLFMLYAGYAGLFQMGFLDGALLRWAGRPLQIFHPEVRLSLKFLLRQQAAFLVPAIAIALGALRGNVRFIGLAVLVYAVLFNINALLQYALQAARQFKPVALAAAAPAGAFVLLTFGWKALGVPSFRVLIVLYCIAWAAALLYLWIRVKPLHGAVALDSTWSFGRTCMLLGWPMVLANIGLGLVQSADRLVLGSALPIYDFAQYSLAASAMFVPVTAIATVYRVFFSHVAAVEHQQRAGIYVYASNFLLMAWSLLLPYFFVLKVFVQYFLPKYLMALPAAGVLLLGVFFLAEIQILHTSFAYLHGRQRQFLLLTFGALLVSFAVALVMALWLRSLVAVAIGQVGALAFWWFANEWVLRETTGQHWKDRLRPVAVFAWSAISYGVALRFTENVGGRIILYYALVVGCLVLTCRPEIRIIAKLLSRGFPRVAACP
jgi:O-antigen/teichoic acid export membrane protein